MPYGKKYCNKHEQQCQGERKNAVLRGYGREWQKAGRFFLKRPSRVRPMQRERAAGSGNRCVSYQAASRRSGLVPGRNELAAPVQELP